MVMVSRSSRPTRAFISFLAPTPLDEEPSIHKRARAKNLQRLAHAFRHSSPQPKFASGSLSDKPPIISELKLTRNFCHAGVGVTLARGLLGFEMLPGAWAW
jgi:hypothetical protein